MKILTTAPNSKIKASMSKFHQCRPFMHETQSYINKIAFKIIYSIEIKKNHKTQRQQIVQRIKASIFHPELAGLKTVNISI